MKKKIHNLQQFSHSNGFKYKSCANMLDQCGGIASKFMRPGVNPIKLCWPKLHQFDVAKLKFIMIYINYDLI